MQVNIKDKKLVIMAALKTIHFNFSQETEKSLKHKIDFIIKQ